MSTRSLTVVAAKEAWVRARTCDGEAWSVTRDLLRAAIASDFADPEMAIFTARVGSLVRELRARESAPSPVCAVLVVAWLAGDLEAELGPVLDAWVRAAGGLNTPGIAADHQPSRRGFG